jgi:DNA-binding transcriptional LysR family regulator
MELRHLRYFVAVAESLHFGHAAVKLRIAQPSLSHQIARLEAELQTVLLARTKRRVELTRAGQVFLPEAREVIARADRAAALARHVGGSDSHLRIGMGYHMNHVDIAAVIGEFNARHQGIQIETRTMSVPSQLASLLDRQLDIGFVRPPVNDPALSAETLVCEPLLIALPRGHRLVSRTTLSLSALADEPFVLPRRDAAPVLHDGLLRACHKAGFRPHSCDEADHLIMILDLVAAGAGVALVPALARKIERRRIVYRLPHPSPETLETAIAWRREDKSSVLAEFISSARQRLTRAPCFRQQLRRGLTIREAAP